MTDNVLKGAFEGLGSIAGQTVKRGVDEVGETVSTGARQLTGQQKTAHPPSQQPSIDELKAKDAAETQKRLAEIRARFTQIAEQGTAQKEQAFQEEKERPKMEAMQLKEMQKKQPPRALTERNTAERKGRLGG